MPKQTDKQLCRCGLRFLTELTTPRERQTWAAEEGIREGKSARCQAPRVATLVGIVVKNYACREQSKLSYQELTTGVALTRSDFFLSRTQMADHKHWFSVLVLVPGVPRTRMARRSPMRKRVESSRPNYVGAHVDKVQSDSTPMRRPVHYRSAPRTCSNAVSKFHASGSEYSQGPVSKPTRAPVRSNGPRVELRSCWWSLLAPWVRPPGLAPFAAARRARSANRFRENPVSFLGGF